MRFLFDRLKIIIVLVGIIILLLLGLSILKDDTFFQNNDIANDNNVSAFSKNNQKVYASGKLVGIYEKTKGALVLDVATIKDGEGDECSPCRNKIQAGDYIIGINGEPVRNKKEIIKYIQKNGRKKLIFNLLRNGKKINKKIVPIETESGDILVGLWVKDDLAGIGTMTYYTGDGKFGALGHGIGDGTTGDLLEVSDGYIYKATLKDIEKGKSGYPGEISGTIIYNDDNRLGKILLNTDIGIYGQMDGAYLDKTKNEDELFQIAQASQIKEDEAYILCEVDGTVKKYKIKINKYESNAEVNKTLSIEVTDKELIKKTGGIVQGMSGSPIIQDGKIIGAVTHVLVNDPTRGYGIFIENML